MGLCFELWVVVAPQSGAFVAKHALRAASSVKVSLQMLLDKELLYHGEKGYVLCEAVW